jgi:hypothetical protein
MYVDVPTNVSAMELMSSPETPKSHIFISPRELNKILEGLISEKRRGRDMNMYSKIAQIHHHVMAFEEKNYFFFPFHHRIRKKKSLDLPR